MPVSKQGLRELYRPVDPKIISLGTSTPNLATGGVLPWNQQVDLSLPIEGFHLRFRGRDTVAGAGMATVAPEGFLNFIANVQITGVNARQQGNITLWNAPMADIFTMSHLVSENAGAGCVSINGVLQPRPTTPYPAGYNPTGAVGTYDWDIQLVVPSYPFRLNGFGKSSNATPLFALRNEEWKDSLQILLTFNGQGNGAVAGALGIGAAATTHVFSAFGSSTGSPTMDMYSLPFISGLMMKDTYLPGLISRVNTPIAAVLQQNGTNVTIANLQKQPSVRIFLKTGTGTVPGAMSSLSDAIVNQVGLSLGGNRNIRNTIDLAVHKCRRSEQYSAPPIQGYHVFDFIPNGNYDSSFPGQDIGDGATWTVNASVTGTAGAVADVIQEQMLHMPAGALAQ